MLSIVSQMTSCVQYFAKFNVKSTWPKKNQYSLLELKNKRNSEFV